MKSLIVFLLLAVFSTLSAQHEDAVLKDIQTRFSMIKDFEAGFIQTTKFLSVENNVTLTGQFYYKPGGKYRIELKGQTIVSDGTNVWNFNRKMNRVVINSVADEPSSFSFDKFIFDYPKLCKITSSKLNDKVTIFLEPETDDLDFQSAKIWFDSDNIIEKLEIRDNSDAVYELSFKNIILNNNIEEKKFSLEPEKGTKIIDLR
ncbi:MAG: outer membrane lipoprotein carrier protein LolA [Melioribacteraceae bacterium]|nr:outer membrane lipoprotein carrier protein LolA [Melioribacteraceae bacterium]